MAKLWVRNGEALNSFTLFGADGCDKPRLAIKSDDSIYYLPLYTGTPPDDVTTIFLKNAGVVYYIVDGLAVGLFPATNLYPQYLLFPGGLGIDWKTKVLTCGAYYSGLGGLYAAPIEFIKINNYCGDSYCGEDILL